MTQALHRLFNTRREFQDALLEAFGEIASAGCREVWLTDEDFAEWPLNSPAVIELLTRWAHSHRRLTLIARGFDELARRHPRWAEWRRQWSHVVECRANEEAAAGEIPTLLLAPGVIAVRLFDRVHCRGSLSRDPADWVRHRELVDAVSQRSVEAFPPTILGI
ncbi:MAG TPA: hypothetical protein VGE16_10590 [Albitalea sp.]